MKNQRIFGICLALYLISFCIGCDPARYTLKGHIYTVINNVESPIQEADIQLECSILMDKKAKSDSKGNFELKGMGFLDDGGCNIYVEHPDFSRRGIRIDHKHLVGEKTLDPEYDLKIEVENELEQ